MTTIYNGLEFDTELEAIWASFFDLAGWQWWYNPVAIGSQILKLLSHVLTPSVVVIIH